MISYFFLGPLFLLARQWTPLAEPYVRGHAMRSSIILGLWGIGYIVYIFLRPLLMIEILSLELSVMVLWAIVSVMILALIHGAYRAYHGQDSQYTSHTEGESGWRSTIFRSGTYTEEEKIRIIASFIPLVGTIIAHRHPQYETLTWRKIGNTAMFFIILGGIFFPTSAIVFFLTVVSIGVFVTTAVYLFLFSQFFAPTAYAFVPRYRDFESHLHTIVRYVCEFFRVAFGGDNMLSYTAIYSEVSAALSMEKQAEIPYLFSPKIFWIPGVNLFTIPSVFGDKYREYKNLILQWVCLTVLMGVSMYWYGTSHPIQFIFLFPIMSLIVESGSNIALRAPITSFIIDITGWFQQGQHTLEKLHQHEEKVGFQYDEKK